MNAVLTFANQSADLFSNGAPTLAVVTLTIGVGPTAGLVGLAPGTLISWGSGSTGIAITQRASDGKFVISTTAGVPLLSIGSDGKLTNSGAFDNDDNP